MDIVTGLARLRIVREYESLMESVGMSPGVVMSSTLAALPLLSDGRPSLLARVAGTTLTTAIVREGVLCGYRCITLPADVQHLTPQALLDEVYPLTAYYQDTWSEGIAQVHLAGLAERTAEFHRAHGTRAAVSGGSRFWRLRRRKGGSAKMSGRLPTAAWKR